MTASADTQAAEREVRQAHEAWMATAARNDLAACDRFIADEFTMVARGTEFDKAQWMRNTERRVALEPVQFLDQRVYVYGDTAVMTQRSIRRYTMDGKDLSGEFFITDVWVRRDGRWQVVRRHGAPVASGSA
jgi:ketosteroid isomerase-like protein